VEQKRDLGRTITYLSLPRERERGNGSKQSSNIGVLGSNGILTTKEGGEGNRHK